MTTIAGTIAAVSQLLEQGGRGAHWLRGKYPEYSKFWGRFEEQLQNEYDVPWEDIQNACHLQPEFVGWALLYIGGDDEARQAMEAHFEAIIEPPKGARETKVEIVARVVKAAEIAANEAPSADRRAALADRRLVVATIADGTAQLTKELRKVAKGVADTERGVSGLQESVGEVQNVQADTAEVLEEIRAGVERQQVAAQDQPQGIDEVALEALLDRKLDEAFERQRGAPEQPTSPEPLLDQERGLDVASQQEYLERLRTDAPLDAERVERLIREGGVVRLAKSIRGQELENASVELLVTAARIVSKSGFYQDAEQAYLQAGRAANDECRKARQLVRAAHTANLQGARERFDRYLDQARELCPDLVALAIAEARVRPEASEMLSRLEGVETEDKEQQALIHQTRAQAYLALDNEDQAREEFDRARSLSPDNVSVREFEAILPWLLAQRQIAAGEQPDRGAVLQAAERFRELSVDARNEQRPDESAHLLARAVEALMLAHEHDQAQVLLDEIRDPERVGEEAAIALGRAALLAQRPDLVLGFIPAGASSAEARLLRADAMSSSTEPELRDEGLAALRAFLTSDEEPFRSQAGFALIAAAATSAEVEWNENAATIVREAQPVAEAAMRAERAYVLGDSEEAERLLLPYAARVTSLRRLRDYAAARGDWKAIADRSRELIRRTGGAPVDQLALADAQDHLGDSSGALAALLDLARDPNVEQDMTDAAFNGALQIAGRGRDYTAIRDLAAEWHREIPASSNALWNYAFGLARLQEHAEAYRVLVSGGAEPESVEQATLFAEVIRRATLPTEETLRRLIELSDRFDRTVEALEALLIATAAEREDEDLPKEVGERVRDALAHFEERFPDSKAIRSIPAPQTPEEAKEFFKKLVGDRPVLQQEANQAVRDGRAPVNVVAAHSPYGLAETWVRLLARPIGFCIDGLDQADREAASAAIGSAAVFDSAALSILCLLPEEARTAMVTSLPGSFITTAALEDAADQNLAGKKPTVTTVHDAEGNVGFEETSEEEHERRQKQMGCLLELAKSLEARPAGGEGTSDELRQLYEEGAGAPELQAATAAVMLASRLGRPLSSDDRWIREFARSQDVPAFGTLALLEVLRTRGAISQDLIRTSRAALAAAHAWGVALTHEELIDDAGRVGFTLTPVLIGALHDRAQWRARPANMCENAAAFLGAVHEANPGRLRVWVRRVIDAGTSCVPEVHRSWVAEVLLVMAWGGGGDAALSDEAFRALIDEIKALPPHLTTLGYDAVMGALNQFLMHAAELPAHDRAQLFVFASGRLRTFDQLRAMERFVADFPRLGI